MYYHIKSYSGARPYCPDIQKRLRVTLRRALLRVCKWNLCLNEVGELSMLIYGRGKTSGPSSVPRSNLKSTPRQLYFYHSRLPGLLVIIIQPWNSKFYKREILKMVQTFHHPWMISSFRYDYCDPMVMMDWHFVFWGSDSRWFWSHYK